MPTVEVLWMQRLLYYLAFGRCVSICDKLKSGLILLFKWWCMYYSLYTQRTSHARYWNFNNDDSAHVIHATGTSTKYFNTKGEFSALQSHSFWPALPHLSSCMHDVVTFISERHFERFHVDELRTILSWF